jgi:16S rRNA (guanine527-N7)-methyltransferase
VKDFDDGPADPQALLREGLDLLHVPEPDMACAKLSAYMDELERWNPRFGLVKYADRRELVIKHVLDSLAGWTAVRDLSSRGTPREGGPFARSTVLDVGSGAGFPGIPLAVALPGLSFTLLERMARRASFLETCAILLGLANVRVLQDDLADVKEGFDVVTFRAVASLSRFLQDMGGSGVRWRGVVAYKGRAERAREEIEDVRRLGEPGVSAELLPVRTPFLDEERCLALITRRGEADWH